MPTLESVFQRGVETHLAGNLSAAARCYASVLQVNPKDANAWHLAGLVAHQCGRTREGLTHIQRAIELNPHNAEYYCNLATLLRALVQPHKALLAADTAISIDPQLAAAWHQRGSILLDLNKSTEAIESFRHAQDLGQPTPLVYRNIALALQYSGNIGEAVEFLEKSLREDAHQPAVYYRLGQLVNSGHYEFNDEQRSVMRGIVNTPSTPSKLQARVHSALASDHDVRGEYSEAFHHYRKANELHCDFLTRQKRVVLDKVAFAEEIDRQIDLYRDFELPTTSSCHSTSCPVFVVGMPRSGTTLISQMLGSHSDISSAGELTAIPSLFANRQMMNSDGLENLLDPTERSEDAQNYLGSLNSTSPSTPFVIDKMPENFKYLGFIATLFPHAKIVHCQRDPRDVCLSAYCQLFESDRLQLETSELSLLGQNYRHYRRLMDHWNKVLPIEIHHVTYEDVLEDTETELRRLLGYLELPWSDTCLNYHEQSSVVRTASATQVRQPLYRTSRGRWQRYQSHLGPLIEALGDAIE